MALNATASESNCYWWHLWLSVSTVILSASFVLLHRCDLIYEWELFLILQDTFLANWFNNLLLKSKIHQGHICLLLKELSLRICLFITSTSALDFMRTDPYFLFVKVACESVQPQRPAWKHPVISEKLNKYLNSQDDLHNTIQIASPLPLVKYRVNWGQTARLQKSENRISVRRFPLLSQIWRMHVSQPH